MSKRKTENRVVVYSQATKKAGVGQYGHGAQRQVVRAQAQTGINRYLPNLGGHYMGRGLKGGNEKKCCDIALNTANFLAAPAPILLNGLVQGAANHQRIASRIAMATFHLRGQFITLGGGAGVADYLRLIVFYDRQSNGTTPAVSDILRGVDSAGVATVNSHSPINIANSERYLMLLDIGINVPNNSPAAVPTELFPCINNNSETAVSRYMRLKDMETHYKDATAGIGDITTGALWLMPIGSNAGAAYAFKFSGRLRYWD